MINEAHAQFDFYDQLTGTNDPSVPLWKLRVSGTSTATVSCRATASARRTELADNLTFTLGRHTLKAGAYTLIRNEHSDSATFFSGRFTFGPLPGGLVNAALASTTINSLQAFNLGLAQSYQQGFGDGVVKATYPLYAGFVQDEWRVTPALTINAGLRYEVDNRRAPLPTDHKEIGPRFGFAWSPNGKTVVRGGYGIYYATIDYQIDYSVYALGVTPSRFPPDRAGADDHSNAGRAKRGQYLRDAESEGRDRNPYSDAFHNSRGSDAVRHQYQPDRAAAAAFRGVQRRAELSQPADTAGQPGDSA